MESNRSVARFATELLVVRCVGPGGPVQLVRSGAGQLVRSGAGSGSGPQSFTVSTTSIGRTLAAQAVPGARPALAATLPAADPLLDAIAFSRGRFALATPGLPTLYIPSWPELSRVIEDCR